MEVNQFVSAGNFVIRNSSAGAFSLPFRLSLSVIRGRIALVSFQSKRDAMQFTVRFIRGLVHCVFYPRRHAITAITALYCPSLCLSLSLFFPILADLHYAIAFIRGQRRAF